MLVKFLEREVFYPAVSEYGNQMPYDINTNAVIQFKSNPTYNQMMPLLLSNMGRVIYRKDGFIANFSSGVIVFDSEVEVIEAGIDLKSAYRYCTKHIFAKDNYHIHSDLIMKPVYNTWMFCPYKIQQEEVLRYAREIQNLSLENGTIIIDDKWEKNYGDYCFDKEKFPNVKAMVMQLKQLGFRVMVWISPYISFDSKNYLYAKDNDLLLKCKGEVYPLQWWNGISACLDLRKSEAREYIRTCLSRLMEIGIDGFKMDGGDSMYYLVEHEPDLQSHLWASMASQYDFNEIRSSYYNGGMSIYNRLSDKQHTWDGKGIISLVPSTLALSLMGQPFSSPDMIGGGEVKDLLKGRALNRDIYLAHLQTAVLLPSMQFSILPNTVLKDMHECYQLLSYRKKYSQYIYDVLTRSMCDKSPMARLLEYVFPHQGFEKEIHQFMLGDKLLVAPIYQENQTEMQIRLPKGRWKYQQCVFDGDQTIKLSCCLHQLIVLERQDV